MRWKRMKSDVTSGTAILWQVVKRRATRGIAFAIVVSLSFFAASCDAIDLSRLSVTLWPSSNGAIIAAGDSVRIAFSEDILHGDAETATSLKSFSSSVEYDVSWDGRSMIITPLEGWRAGASYTLRCDGAVSAADGRTFDVAEAVTFYAVTSAAPAILAGQNPANDTIVPTAASLILSFSKPLNPLLIERYVTTSPSCELSVVLSSDGMSLTVAPRTKWEGLTRYQWTILDDLTDVDGVPIKEEYRGSFRVQEDITPLEKPSIAAVDPDNLSIEVPLTAVQKRSGLLLRFTEDVDSDSLSDCLTIEPDVSMTIRSIDARTFVAYQEDADWVSGTEYTVKIGKGLADANGNLTLSDFDWKFTAPYEPLRVVSITNSPSGPNEIFDGSELESTDPLVIGVHDTTYAHDFIIKFSENVSATERARLVEALSIERVFPFSVSDPNIFSLLGSGDTTVTVRVTNFSVPTDGANGERVIYKLTIKGGDTGFKLDDGNAMNKDLVLYLETV